MKTEPETLASAIIALDDARLFLEALAVKNCIPTKEEVGDLNVLSYQLQELAYQFAALEYQK